MPPDRHSSRTAFDINILDSQTLDTADGLHTALRTIEAICHRGDPEIVEMVVALNSRSHILEYIISGALRVPTGSCVLPPPIILLSSAGGGGVREALEVDSFGVPHANNS